LAPGAIANRAEQFGAGGCRKKGVLLELVEKMDDLCDKSAMS
jgi:hypothetical protein